MAGISFECLSVFRSCIFLLAGRFLQTVASECLMPKHLGCFQCTNIASETSCAPLAECRSYPAISRIRPSHWLNPLSYILTPDDAPEPFVGFSPSLDVTEKIMNFGFFLFSEQKRHLRGLKSLRNWLKPLACVQE